VTARQHPKTQINWSEVTRQAIHEKIETLDVMAELTSGSELSESDIADIDAAIRSDDADFDEQAVVETDSTSDVIGAFDRR